MKFEVFAELIYDSIVPSTLILNIQPFKTVGQRVLEERFDCNMVLKSYEWYANSGEKRFKVLEVPQAQEVVFTYSCVVENQIKTIPARQLDDVQISLMPVSVLPYLNPSRYCESDKLYKFAFDKFGSIESTFEKVMAIRDWIYDNVEYKVGVTSAQTSAYDTLNEQIGVCRDFAHLGVALCRAMTIPARYFTGYAYRLVPQDFHACFEVYLGGYWVIVDATKLMPINGLVKIATSFDATDTALASSFGNLNFKSMAVKISCLDQNFEALDSDSLAQGYVYY
ncbi:transglutaminase-like domain-containing protein [Pedobacter sp. JCM 36344]|uniref:transglutaminase-like domain-containing protein n=1 Tax=Pedobacter sp. JCM 36344 TaxID=3374280 RepID=UPI0039797F40